jgi:hypothetical protein
VRPKLELLDYICLEQQEEVGIVGLHLLGTAGGGPIEVAVCAIEDKIN